MRFFLLMPLILLFIILPILPITILKSLGLAQGWNEGNSWIATLPWFLFFTIPIGSISLMAILIYEIFFPGSHPD